MCVVLLCFVCCACCCLLVLVLIRVLAGCAFDFVCLGVLLLGLIVCVAVLRFCLLMVAVRAVACWIWY